MPWPPIVWPILGHVVARPELAIDHNRPSKFRSVMKLAPVSFQFTKCVFRRLLYSATHTPSVGMESSATPYGQTPTHSVSSLNGPEVM